MEHAAKVSLCRFDGFHATTPDAARYVQHCTQPRPERHDPPTKARLPPPNHGRIIADKLT